MRPASSNLNSLLLGLPKKMKTVLSPDWTDENASSPDWSDGNVSSRDWADGAVYGIRYL